jgi:hypothetical protein
MWRTFWTVAAIVGVLLAALLWASSESTFLFNHPRTEGLRVEIDKETGGAVVVQPVSLETSPLAEKSPGTLAPKAVTPETEFDFGTMDPLTSGKHEFVIENTGAAPLKLTVGPTTCKCTVSGLEKQEIAPGEKGLVTLEWNTGRSILYSHSATIYTDDPSRKSIDFWVFGKIRLHLGTDVPEIALADVDPQQAARFECLVYSQTIQDFTIQAVDSKFDDLEWDVDTIAPQAVPDKEATAIQRLRVTIPAANLASRFSDTLRLHVQAAGNDAIEVLDLAVHGNVLGRYTIYGPAIEGDAVVLGAVPQGQSKKATLLVKLRDPEPLPADARVEVTPSVLRASLTPRNEAEGHGIYTLTVELPDNAPVCQFLGTPQGKITIHTGHPRIANIDMNVRFAVVESRN